MLAARTNLGHDDAGRSAQPPGPAQDARLLGAPPPQGARDAGAASIDGNAWLRDQATPARQEGGWRRSTS